MCFRSQSLFHGQHGGDSDAVQQDQCPVMLVRQSESHSRSSSIRPHLHNCFAVDFPNGPSPIGNCPCKGYLTSSKPQELKKGRMPAKWPGDCVQVLDPKGREEPAVHCSSRSRRERDLNVKRETVNLNPRSMHRGLAQSPRQKGQAAPRQRLPRL